MSALTNYIATNLVNKRVRIELKNSVTIEGTLIKVDPSNLNAMLEDVSAMGLRPTRNGAGGKLESMPHGQALKSMFVRGSTILFIDMVGPKEQINTTVLADSCKKAAVAS